MNRMHEDQVDVDEDLLRRLLRAQLPQWAELPVTAVAERGTDHALYRLGHDLVARLPVVGWADGQAALEAEWLPRLAPHLPVALSVPLALGQPDECYPFRWSVHPWLPGTPLDPAAVDQQRLALDLAGFVRGLQACDGTGAGLFGSRGGPLADAERDRETRLAIAQSAPHIDAGAALEVWEAARAAPAWHGSPTWFHGDLTEGNLLVDRRGRLSGVLDWGPFGAGDPAVELHTAYVVLNPAARTTFRDALDPDDASWRRARGWTVSIAAMLIPYYRELRPELAARGIRMIESVLAEE